MEESERKSFFLRFRLYQFHLFQGLDSALYHGRFFHIGSEPVNKFLLFLNLFFLVVICLSLSFQTGSTFLEIKGVISLVAIECTKLQFNRPLSNGFQKCTVVGDHQNGTLVAFEVMLQPVL